MAAFRQQQQLEDEAKQKFEQQRLQETAKLENAIAASDKKAAAGVATKKGKTTISTTAVKKSFLLVPVRKAVPNVSATT